MIHPVEGLEIDLEWPDGIEPSDWRNQPDPDSQEEDEAALEDDDENLPTPDYVMSMLGFDPDEFKEQ